MGKKPKLRAGDKVQITSGFYRGHYGVIARVEESANPKASATYHVTGGSIGDLAPIFSRQELKRESPKS